MTKSFHISGRLFLIVLVIGAALRAFVYFQMPALWLDEALTANRLMSVSLISLAYPVNGCFDCMHAYPIGFLSASKIAIFFIKSPELSLRFVPFVSSILALVVFQNLVKRIFEPLLALLMCFLFAVSYPLIYHAVELKPYSSDVLIAVFLIWYALRILSSNKPPRFTRCCLNIFYALLCSFTSVFIIFPYLGLWVLEGFWKRLKRKVIMNRIAVLVFSLGVQGGYFFLSLRHFYHDTPLVEWWGMNFLPVLKGLPACLQMLWFNFSQIFLFWGIHPVLGVLLVIAGIVMMAKKNMRHFGLFVLPLLAVLGASALHRYPFARRTVTFLIPLFIIYFGYVLKYFYERRSSFFHLFMLAVISAAIAVPMSIKSVSAIPNFSFGEDIRPLIIDLNEKRLPGEGLYLNEFSFSSYIFYSTSFGFKTDYTGMLGDDIVTMPNKVAAVSLVFQPFADKILYFLSEDGLYLKAHKGKTHFIKPGKNWFLFVHSQPQPKAAILNYLKQIGRQVSVMQSDSDAELYLYDIKPRPLRGDVH